MSKNKKKTEIVEIACRCKDCEYGFRRKKSDIHMYCRFWDYEAGMEPNQVSPDGFCSNGRLDI